MDLASFDTGSANPTVNRNLVHPAIVSWPPVGEQPAIANYLDREMANINRMVAKVESNQGQCNFFYDALLKFDIDPVWRWKLSRV
ncbi:MAG TPA: hypothetical protein VJ733_13715 [Candidatus Binatia bacterium]|nr:hypothetical protein [Candidatus Binatia bacterium]